MASTTVRQVLRTGRGTVYSPSKYRETEGIKDLNSYTPSIWRKSTADEIEGHLPANAIMGRFIHAGGANAIKELTAYASVTDATLVDMEDGDAGTPIYVMTSKSSPQSVEYTGSPTIAVDSNGKTAYSYAGQTAGAMNIHSYNGSGGTVENKDYTGAYTVNYTVSSATRYTSDLYSKASDGSYYKNNQVFYTGYKKSTLAVTGTDTGSGSAKLVFTPKSKNWSSGVVIVTPYSPEIVRAQKIKQGVLTQAATRDVKYDYYTYIPSSAEESSGTFLVKGASTAVQNFAFYGMDDIE